MKKHIAFLFLALTITGNAFATDACVVTGRLGWADAPDKPCVATGREDTGSTSVDNAAQCVSYYEVIWGQSKLNSSGPSVNCIVGTATFKESEVYDVTGRKTTTDIRWVVVGPR